MAKVRLDLYLVEHGYFDSREKAKRAIMAGQIRVDSVLSDKAGNLIKEDAIVTIVGEKLPYVSRGGLKLKQAIDVFGIDFSGLTVVDLGASTGGFTDVALQNGAVKVFAVDVGYGQLDWKLRSDERVIVLEKTNARYLTAEQITEPIDFVTCDASFISLTKLIEPILPFLKDDARLCYLIKPQFEAGREKVGKKGVVRELSTHIEVIEKVTSFVGSLGLNILGLVNSPIKGPEGNIEYLLYMSRVGEGIDLDIPEICSKAFNSL